MINSGQYSLRYQKNYYLIIINIFNLIIKKIICCIKNVNNFIILFVFKLPQNMKIDFIKDWF